MLGYIKPLYLPGRWWKGSFNYDSSLKEPLEPRLVSAVVRLSSEHWEGCRGCGGDYGGLCLGEEMWQLLIQVMKKLEEEEEVGSIL